MSQADEADAFSAACVKMKDMMMKKRSRLDPDDQPLLDVDVELKTCDDLDPITIPKAKIMKKSPIDQDDECDELDPVAKPKKSKAKKSPIDQDDEPLLDDANKDLDVPLIAKRPKKVFPTTFAEVKVRFFFAFDNVMCLYVFFV
jgi:hypothetical protein